MSLRCPQCGTETSTDSSFCPQCGGRLPQVAAPQPQTPQPQTPAPQPPVFQTPVPQPPAFQPPTPQPPYGAPQAPYGMPQGFQPPLPPRRKGSSWLVWLGAAIGGLLLLAIGGIALLAYFGDEKPATPPTPPSSSNTPTPAPAPAPAPAPSNSSTAGFKLSLALKGTLPSKGQAELYGTWGKYLAEGKGSKATFYMFDEKGNVRPVNTVDDPQAGKMLYLTVGDMMNAGTPVMVVVYESKVYVAPPTGTPQVIESKTTDQVLIGDYDGDGKQETIFMGQGYFNVFRYMQGGDTKPIYRKDGISTEQPLLWATRQKAGNQELLFGHKWEGDKLSLILYKWDGAGGAVPIVTQAISDSGTAEWAASGPSALGATLALSRKTAPASVEFFQVASDGKSVKSLGTVKAEGQGIPAIMIGDITTPGKPQLLTIDEAGNWFLYTIAAK